MSETADEQGVAFAEGGKKGGYSPTCHGCSRKCNGGWRECMNITEDHRSKVAALDAAGHFRRDNNINNDSKKKKDTVNVVEGLGKDDATKSEGSNTSGLTKDMTIGELLRLTGVINTTVGMKETDGKIYEIKWQLGWGRPSQHGCWVLPSSR